MKKRCKDVWKKACYLFMVVVLLVGSMPVQSVYAEPITKSEEKASEETGETTSSEAAQEGASAEGSSSVEESPEEPQSGKTTKEGQTTVEDPTEEPTTVEDPTEEPTSEEDPTEEPTTVEDPTDEPTPQEDVIDAYLIAEDMELSISKSDVTYTDYGRALDASFQVGINNNISEPSLNEGKTPDGYYEVFKSGEPFTNGNLYAGDVTDTFTIHVTESGRYEVKVYVTGVMENNPEEECTRTEAASFDFTVYEGYLFDTDESNNIRETFSIEEVADSDVVSADGQHLTRTFQANLTGFHTAANNNQQLDVKVTVKKDGKTLSNKGKTFSYTESGSQTFDIIFDEVGEYTFTVTASGYRKTESGAYTKVNNITLGTATIQVAQKTQDICIELSATEIGYGQSFTVSDTGLTPANEAFPGTLCMEEENEEEKILTLNASENTFRATGMNSTGTTTVKVWREGTVFYEPTEEVEFAITVNKAVLDSDNIKFVLQTPMIEFHDSIIACVTITPDAEYSDLFKDNTDLEITYKLQLKDDAQGNPRYRTYTYKNKNFSVGENNAKTCEFKKRTSYSHWGGDFGFGEMGKGEYALEATVSCVAENSPYVIADSAATGTDTVVVGSTNAELTISMAGEKEKKEYSYREIYKQNQNLTLQIKKGTKELSDDEKASILCNVELGGSAEKVIKLATEDIVYYAKDGKIPFQIVGVGEATITITPVDESENYTIEGKTIQIIVKNSDLRNEDYTVTYTDAEEENTDYTNNLEGLREFLETQNNWVNGSVNIALSEEGKKYYQQINYNVDGASTDVTDKTALVLNEEGEMHTYSFWAVNTDTAATTKGDSNGVFTIGIDRTAPASTKFDITQNQYYESTSTEEIQYFAEDYVVNGTFEDNASGIRKLQYTTNADKGEQAKWIDLETEAKDGDHSVNYSFTLGHGKYSGIAVRAIDVAGNVSEVIGVKNATDEYITLVIDASEPVIGVMATTEDGNEYTGEWTNQAVTYTLSDLTDETFIAGIYQYQYQYVKVGGSYRASDETAWKKVYNKQITIGAVRSVDVDKDTNTVILTDKNGTYYFRAITKCGVITSKEHQDDTSKRIRLQQNLAEMKEIQESGAAEDRKNEWYNKKSGVPQIDFAYPEYDNGVTSKEYDAPITIHYEVTVEGAEGNASAVGVRTATIGVQSDEEYEALCKQQEPQTPQDALENIRITFGYQRESGYAEDGIYTLKYWITDAAGNKTEPQEFTYKIDTHEPTDLAVFVDGTDMNADSGSTILFDRFYQNSVSGNASAEYGVSGKDSLKILKAKKVGEWNSGSGWIQNESDSFDITPCTRCFIYAIAEDIAGNTTETWTKGIVVDNEVPSGAGTTELVLTPSGANDAGFYNDDIEVKVAAMDMPNDDNYASLASVTYAVGKDGANTESRELFSFTKSLPTEEELIAAQKYESVQVINAETNESNAAFIEVTATDRSGNITTTTQVLKIDVTKPVVEITFDNMSAQHENYYKANRTATIRVTELNFDPSDVEIHITKDGEDFYIAPSGWSDNGGIEHYATVAFTEDGDYTMSVDCKDMADNIAETATIDAFTLDKTKPEVEVRYDNNNANKENYYNAARTATITITEHNFDAADFILHVEPAVALSGWTHNGDVHTATLSFREDNHYTFHCEYTDLAGNVMDIMEQEEFYIDMVAPEVLISGVEDGSANGGDIAPVVTVYDENYDVDGVNITVTTGRGEVINTIKVASAVAGGYAYALTDLNDREDNIYYLQASGMDMAGNETSLTYRFSLNRHGSTYDLTNMSDIVEKTYNKYADVQDMQILEMNVDTIENFSVYISRNGTMLSSREVSSRPSGVTDEICYAVDRSGNESVGYTYTYTIFRENFAQEGTYNISFYSKDRAGNEVNNTLNEKGAEIHFIIDNTVPTVIIDGIETGELYSVDSQSVNVMVTDNFKLSEAEFYLTNEEGEQLASWDYADIVSTDGEIATIEIPSYDGRQSLLFRAMDAAGNEVVAFPDSEDTPTAFMITTNPWLRFTNSPKAMATAAGVVGVIVIGGTGAGVFMKKRKVKKAAQTK